MDGWRWSEVGLRSIASPGGHRGRTRPTCDATEWRHMDPGRNSCTTFGWKHARRPRAKKSEFDCLCDLYRARQVRVASGKCRPAIWCRASKNAWLNNFILARNTPFFSMHLVLSEGSRHSVSNVLIFLTSSDWYDVMAFGRTLHIYLSTCCSVFWAAWAISGSWHALHGLPWRFTALFQRFVNVFELEIWLRAARPVLFKMATRWLHLSIQLAYWPLGQFRLWQLRSGSLAYKHCSNVHFASQILQRTLRDAEVLYF
jgi:hypothetical protein